MKLNCDYSETADLNVDRTAADGVARFDIKQSKGCSATFTVVTPGFSGIRVHLISDSQGFETEVLWSVIHFLHYLLSNACTAENTRCFWL